MISGSARGASFSGINQVLVVAIACEHLRTTAEIHNQPSRELTARGIPSPNGAKQGQTVRRMIDRVGC
jgi:hypothetical protein